MDYTLREKIKILPFVLWVKWLFPHLDCTRRSCGYFLVGIVCGSCGSCLSNRLSYPLALGMSTGSTIWVQTAYPRKHLIWRLVFSPSQNFGKEKLLRKAWYSSFESFFQYLWHTHVFPFLSMGCVCSTQEASWISCLGSFCSPCGDAFSVFLWDFEFCGWRVFGSRVGLTATANANRFFCFFRYFLRLTVLIRDLVDYICLTLP